MNEPLQTQSPYKFLDYYRVEDKDLFFGRNQETQILLADIVINRLVVLFAKTGTGKTSLINAGVRPLLHEREYETFFIRVRKDPIVSAQAHLFAGGYELEGPSLAAQLENLSNTLDKSIVLFFDQFEEFFIYVGGNSEKGLQFIGEVGTIYRNERSGVHLVFSMREEFLYELDHFRNEIPTIFHNDSTLRLRGFNRSQAHEAITRPAAQFGRSFHPDLVERLLDDLMSINDSGESKTREIEPTQLQIVCDTLWQTTTGDSIVLDDYLTPADETQGVNPAQRMLDERLEAELSNIETDEDLHLLDRLLPLLRTDANTKNVRDVSGLTEVLGTERHLLDHLLQQLRKSRLIQESGKGDSILIELSHDYLADAKRIEYLQDRVRNIWLNRKRSRGSAISIEDLQRISDNLSNWRLDRNQASFLFRSAISSGWEMRKWFDQAKRSGVGVWDILREKIDSVDESESGNAVELLRELHEPEAIKLLGSVIERQPSSGLVKPTIEAAAHSRNPAIAKEAQNILTQILAKFPEAQSPNVNKSATTFRHLETTYNASWKSKSETRFSDFKSSADPPLSYIREQLLKGEVIPFLGAGASLLNLPEEEGEQSSSPLTADTLAKYLADKINFPGAEDSDLGTVAQYFSIVAGRHPLQEQLHEIFSRQARQSKLHSFLADLPQPLLILTTNYDDMIEQAFEANGRPYDLVVYSADQSSGEQLLWRQHATGETRAVQPNSLDIDLERITVIYKMNGSIDRKQPESESFVITDDDYVEYLSQMSNNRVIPAVLAAPLQTRHLLFLGYSVQDWGLRGVLNRFERDVRRPKGIRSWAIQPRPTTLETAYWQSRRVEVFDMTIEHFVDKLSNP